MVKLKTQTPQNVSSNESMFDVKLAFITFVACIIYACWIEKDSAALSGMYLKNNDDVQAETSLSVSAKKQKIKDFEAHVVKISMK
jgi:hypothetical protein